MNYMRISKQKFKNKWFKHITQKENASFQQVTTKITVLKQLTFEKIENQVETIHNRKSKLWVFWNKCENQEVRLNVQKQQGCWFYQKDDKLYNIYVIQWCDKS